MMPPTDEPISLSREDEIFRIARQCHLNFSETINSFQPKVSKAQLPVPLPESSFHHADLASILEDVSDEHEQLRSWARNLGAFALGHGSLDYRLRDAAEIRDSIVSLLTSLNTEVVNCLLITQTDSPAIPMDEAKASADCSSSESDGSDEADALDSSTVQRFVNSLKYRVDHISDVINKLTALGRIIRASGSTSRTSKAAIYRPDEDGIDWTNQFENHFLPRILKDRFHLEDPLLSRFVKAISLRRRTFMFLAKHQKKLAYGGELPHEIQTRTVNAKVKEMITMNPILPLSQGTERHNISRKRSLSLVSLPTEATTFQSVQLRNVTRSRIISASTKMNINQIEIPPPPSVPLRAVYFECPYCCVFVPRETLASTNWRHHVIADLQPYICLEPECHSPDTVFDTKADWIDHQKWEHSMEWWCDGHETDHPPMVFATAGEYAQHMKDDHAVDEAHVLDKRISTAGRPSLSPFSCCPLCDFRSPVHTAHADNSLWNSTSTVISEQQKLQRHIADELLTIFLVALPDREDLQDMGSETNAESRKRSTVQALSDVSLRFEDRDSYELISEQDSSTVEIEEQTPYSSDPPITDVNFCDELWSRVWNSPQLQESVRGAYQGIEQDGLLENFAVQTSLGNEYKVAWITHTLPYYLHCLAALDEMAVSVHPNDPARDYARGRIGHLHVVIVLLSLKTPKYTKRRGESEDILKLRASVPSIQYVFTLTTSHSMKDTIRTGDIVIGFPKAQTPAVLQFEFDAANVSLTQSESTIDQPPQAVLDASSRLRDKYGYVRGLPEAWHYIQEKRLRVKSESSARLTPPRYLQRQHGDGPIDHSSPIVHCGPIGLIGLIANGASLSDYVIVESERHRDLLCLEESFFTGTSIHVPCVMIRGIGQYHGFKHLEEANDSLSAAVVAYAKILLLEMSHSISTLRLKEDDD